MQGKEPSLEMGPSRVRSPSRRSAVPPFIVMDVMEAAAAREAQGKSVIHMEVGQPATPAPRSALAAVASALPASTLGYTPALGMPSLRERIARHYHERYGLSVAADRIVVTTGSSAGFVLAFLALFDAGARVALPSPGYPCYRHILTALGQIPTLIEMRPEDRWMPTAGQIEEVATRETIRGLVLASPSNPTGTMLPNGRLAEIAAVCDRNGIWLIADEIYHGLTYTFPEETALAASVDAVVVNSFSKYFSMTGWRIGWLVVPERLIRPIERLAQNFYISPPAVAQVAAIGAFDGREELEANKRVYAENRALLLAELPNAGFDRILPAGGAFYLYIDISQTRTDSVAFTRAMLEEIGVAATPGVDFDGGRGGNYVRLCYAGKTADVAEAIHRLKAWRRPRRP
jgi:aspartate/methionine/tyrosine aminotransferase